MSVPQAYPTTHPEPQGGYPPQSYGQPQYNEKGGFDQPQPGAAYPPQGYPQQHAYPPQQGYPAQAPPGYYDQQQTSATTVVVAQPALITQVEPGLKPNNYIVLSIVNLLFCFFILGIIALIFSLQVDSSWSAGRYEDARRSSNTAKILNYIGIGIGIASWVVVGIIVVIRIVLTVALTV